MENVDSFSKLII